MTNIFKLSVDIAQVTDFPSDIERWDDFVYNHPLGTFFHRYGWSQLTKHVMNQEPVYLMAICKDTNVIRGVLPLTYIDSRLFGRSLISTAYTIGGGMLVLDEEAENRLLEKAVAIGREFKVDYIELRGGDKPKSEGWTYKDDVYAGFIQPIDHDVDACLKKIPRKKRADIRKGINAEKAGNLKVRNGASAREFYTLYAESLRNLGTPVFPVDFIQTLKSVFFRDIEISVIESAGKPVAGLVSFHYKNATMPYYGGAIPSARRLHAYDYLYWSQMRTASEKGMEYFDFGRSKFGTGAFDYKCHWGFKPEALSYGYYLIGTKKIPNINPKNPKYAALTKTWRRLPLPVANKLGPYIARNIG